jgi:hypothetical protein
MSVYVKYCIAVILGSLVLGSHIVFSQVYLIPAVQDPVYEQLPVLYVHGFNDDGRFWAIHPETEQYFGTPAHYWSGLGINTYVVQWWAPQGFPYATADMGWARFFTPQEIRGEVTGVTPYNSSDPVKYFFDNFHLLNNSFTAALFMIELYNRRIQNNYNRNGRVEAHARNMMNAFRSTDGFGGKLQGYRQVNMITHSAGGLDTRALLSLLNESEDQREREQVANVIYTAPPFGGSNMAEIARIIYQPAELDRTMFQDPWFQAGMGDKSVDEFIRLFLRSFSPSFIAGVVEKLMDWFNRLYMASAVLAGVNPPPDLKDIKTADLVTNDALADVVANTIQTFRSVVTYTIGFPGDPKVWDDLTYSGAVDHLFTWQPNYHTRQFVTWGEGGPQINATPSLVQARADFNSFTNPVGTQRFADDFAVSNVSARVLATPEGGMTELKGYPALDHGGIALVVEAVANDWATTLLTPVTKMLVSGNVKYAHEQNRYFIVGPTAQFTFDSEIRSFTDRFANTINATAKEIEYRVVVKGPDQSMLYHDWVTVSDGHTASFATLTEPYDLSGERQFRMDWRAVNQADAREAIRSAYFAIDDLPPSLTNVQIFHVGVENSTEIFGNHNRSMEGYRLISSQLTPLFQQTPWLAQVENKPLMDWIVKDQSNKIMLLQFDQDATITYQWNQPLTDPETRNTVNQNISFILTELPDGPNTLYFRARDNAGNETNVRLITVLVDNQPPSVALDYEPPTYLNWVVGSETPLSILAEDLGTQVVTGSIVVPGFTDPLPLGSTFSLNQTDIADQGKAIGAYGIFVPITVQATDAVGNSVNETFQVYYDWTPPELDLQYVGRNQSTQGNVYLRSDGTYITSERRIHVEITVTTNAAGFGLVVWQNSNPQSDLIRGGGPFVGNQFIRGFAYGGWIDLFDGENHIVISTTDDYGQHASIIIVVERTDELFQGVERPIELVVDGGTDQIAYSDDGSVYVFRRNNGIFAWRNGEIVRVDVNEEGEVANERARNPAISGSGRYVYFASRATNLVDETVSGKNLYVKDLQTGKIALLSRDTEGNPVNMNVAFANLSFVQNTATFSGRYLFFADRYANYIDDDTNTDFDIFVVDLDPDLNGDFFDSSYEIRRVSVGPGGVQGTGGPSVATAGSRFPSVSADGLYLVFETTHTNLFPNDNNNNTDAVLMRFGGVDSFGTLDLTNAEIIPLNVNENGSLNTWGGRAPWVDRTGRVAVFRTAANLLASDANREGVDDDIYSSTGFIENWKNRVIRKESRSSSGASVQGNMWGTPTVSDYDAQLGSRVAFVSDMDQLVPGDNNETRDLFVRSEYGLEAINWITPEVPAGGELGITGGVTPDGRWAWWNTVYKYTGITYEASGRALHRRHIDPVPPLQAPLIIQNPADRDVYLGQSASFSVHASGYPLPSYQWYFNGEIIEGAIQSVLTLQNVTLSHRGEYSAAVVNDLGSQLSEPARLNVTSLKPMIAAHPQSKTADEGSDTYLTADAIGVAPLQFRWQRNGIDLQNSERISGSDSDTLTIFGSVFGDAGEYRVIVTNGAGADTSNIAILAIIPASSVTYRQGIPDVFALHQNFPNPFNPSTYIRYDIPKESDVTLEIYNVLGQRISVLVREYQQAGYYNVHFDAGHLSSGVYFYRVQAGEFTDVRKLMLIR